MKTTKGEWESRGNKIFIKDTYTEIAIACVQNNYNLVNFKPIEDVERIANQSLMVLSGNLAQKYSPETWAESLERQERIRQVKFMERVELFVKNVQVNDAMSEEEKQFILDFCNV